MHRLALMILFCLQAVQSATLHDRALGHAHWIQSIRRALHKEPEIGFQEFETSKMLQEVLKELDIPFKCDLTCTSAARCACAAMHSVDTSSLSRIDCRLSGRPS
jgi:metal-dependent amidase/aminoacylase/carboxypeptidase family protein